MRFAGDIAPGDARVTLDLGEATLLANLEGPVFRPDGRSGIPKAGPHLRHSALPKTSGPLVVSLANNHVFDFGVSGFDATVAALDARQIRWLGAGHSVTEARRPLVVDDGPARWGIVACAERQFGVAATGRGGVAALGPWVYDVIRSLTVSVDGVIVSVHGGMEHSPWPSPYEQDLYRSFIDAGAHVVHGHHAHVPQGIEAYGHGVIFYGLGNLAVSSSAWTHRPHGMWSVVGEVSIAGHGIHWSRQPVEIVGSDPELRVVPLAADVARERYVQAVDAPLGNRNLLEGIWQEVALRSFRDYGAEFIGYKTASRAAPPHQTSRVRTMAKRLLRRGNTADATTLLRYHMFSCESHRQMVITALGLLGNEIPDVRTGLARRMVDEHMPWSAAAPELLPL